MIQVSLLTPEVLEGMTAEILVTLEKAMDVQAETPLPMTVNLRPQPARSLILFLRPRSLYDYTA